MGAAALLLLANAAYWCILALKNRKEAFVYEP